jgi:hypothetical protein
MRLRGNVPTIEIEYDSDYPDRKKSTLVRSCTFSASLCACAMPVAVQSIYDVATVALHKTLDGLPCIRIFELIRCVSSVSLAAPPEPLYGDAVA